MTNFEPTDEQLAIIEADLMHIAVVACPGSGKTATAVRRLATLRDRLSNTRGQIALLSFSNVAVETFRDEYQKLRGTTGFDNKVAIQTMDSFITNYVLRPHCARVMKANRMPFLCLGDEPFLKAYTFGKEKETMGVEDILLDRVNGATVLYRKLHNGNPKKLGAGLKSEAIIKLKEFASVGGYTHAHGRAWARLLLHQEPGITAALALRFPQILVDEAQDVGSFEGEILDLLIKAGSVVSLIGDSHQSIYGFNFATGTYLKDFASRPDVRSLPLTQNRRSLPGIVGVANALAGTSSRPHRTTSNRMSGAFYWRYEDGKLPDLMSYWANALQAEGYRLSEAAALCRGTSLMEQLTSLNLEVGQSAVRHLAAAAIERDAKGDIARTFDHCLRAVMHLVKVPQSFIHDMKFSERGSQNSIMRRLVWDLIRSQNSGIPSATLCARGSWLTKLKANLCEWLDHVEASTDFRRIDTWSARVTKKSLPETGPLLAENLEQNTWKEIRVGTVHSAKGEGIPVVMYFATKKDLNALVAGTSDEEGRIGFVAVTRARDLLIVAIPKNTKPEVVMELQKIGFSDWEGRQRTALAA